MAAPNLPPKSSSTNISELKSGLISNWQKLKFMSNLRHSIPSAEISAAQFFWVYGITQSSVMCKYILNSNTYWTATNNHINTLWMFGQLNLEWNFWGWVLNIFLAWNENKFYYNSKALKLMFPKLICPDNSLCICSSKLLEYLRSSGSSWYSPRLNLLFFTSIY